MNTQTAKVLFVCMLGTSLFLGACAEPSASSEAPTRATTPLTSATTSATPSTNKVAVVVTLSDSRPMNDVVKELKAQGLEVDHVLDQIGGVTGKVSSDGIEKLKAVPGVKAVELDHEVTVQ